MNIINIYLKIYQAHTIVLLLWGYAAPAIFCAIVYSARTLREYKNDIVARNKYERGEGMSYYKADLVIGSIVWRILAIVLPFVNLVCAVANFDRVWSFLGDVATYIEKLFSYAFVKADESKRIAAVNAKLSSNKDNSLKGM